MWVGVIPETGGFDSLPIWINFGYVVWMFPVICCILVFWCLTGVGVFRVFGFGIGVLRCFG